MDTELVPLGIHQNSKSPLVPLYDMARELTDV